MVQWMAKKASYVATPSYEGLAPSGDGLPGGKL